MKNIVAAATHEDDLMQAANNKKPEQNMRRYRANVASRAVAAVGGGYGLAAATAAAGALGFHWLGMDRAHATMAATMLSFIIYAVAAMWAFGCASATRAWSGIALPGLVLASLAWILSQGAAA